MAADGADVETNVFELCALRTLAWRAYAAPARDAAVDAVNADSGEKVHALAALAQHVAQQANALYSWETAPQDVDPSGSERQLWVFVVNDTHRLPSEDVVGSATECGSGEWSGPSGGDSASATADAVLPQSVRTCLFRALNTWMTRQFVTTGEFRLEEAFFTANDAKFVYRRPSLSRVNDFDVYLDEEFPAPAFRLHFQLLEASHLLCVNVDMVLKQPSPVLLPEFSDPRNSWMRLMGLPRDQDHSMVDVWHLDDGLAARTIAEVKYEDVYPRFRAITRRRVKKRKGDDADGTGEDDDNSKSKDDNDDDAEEDEDGTNDGDGDGDDTSRRNGTAKKKRKKPIGDAAENDESIVPASPDTHVNSPDAGGPVVDNTFPNDAESLLRASQDVHHFKKRRRKKHSARMDGKHPKFALSFGPLPSSVAPTQTTSAPVSNAPSRPRSGSGRLSGSLVANGSPSKTGAQTLPTKAEAKPSLSLAVSLVASLTQDEKQEALDAKPVKTHPLLHALDLYVEKEMAARPASQLVVERVRVVPNDPRFSPAEVKKPRNRAVSSFGYLRGQLLSDRFKRWFTGYYPRDYRRSKRVQKREDERRVLLEFDEAKMVQYVRGGAPLDALNTRDDEITFGVQLAASDALAVWRQDGPMLDRWNPSYVGTCAADVHDMKLLAGRVQPYLNLLQASVKPQPGDLAGTDDEAGEVRDPWMHFSDYASKSVAPDEFVSKKLTDLPQLCVSTIDSALNVDLPVISEYLLRNFHPIASPKPVDYVIVCPHSPREWLATLALSYLASFQSVYAQCSMGDQAPVDLTQLESSANVSVDAASALMLVECAVSSQDAFATYRAAGEMLRPLLAHGAKRKQAFSRSAVANVVYVVAPFRRSNIRHKLWLVGAIGRGLFGEEIDTRQSVTLELLYLEDLYDVGVNANPFALAPIAFALYDRVFEQVSLKPVDRAASEAAPSQAVSGKTRPICERLYHLASRPGAADVPAFVYAGYAVSSDNRWLVASFTDSLGSIVETRTIALVAEDVPSGFLQFVEAAMEFVALFGVQSTLVITRLDDASADAHDMDSLIWQGLAQSDTLQQLASRFEAVVSKILFGNVRFISKERVQLRGAESSALLCHARDGFLVQQPDDVTQLRERSRVSNARWLSAIGVRPAAAVVLQVTIAESRTLGWSPDGLVRSELAAADMEIVLRDFWALSFLTMHPLTLQRQSPLPAHLAAVDRLRAELVALHEQLTTDPLVARR